MQTLTPGVLLNNGTFRIERVLGQGGFGITYLAFDTSLDRKVAIKEFFPKDYCDREGATRHVTLGTQNAAQFVNKLKAKFLKEAKNIAKFDHPGIIKIHAAFEENNTAYYVMDFIEGESLSAMVKRSGPLPEAKALKYIEQVGRALEYVHTHRMNHLDVKPANIMLLKKDDEPILIDFGLSKQYDSDGNQTSTTPVGISHGYAPMEQYNDGGVKEFSPQTDLYSLAATLYYILSGIVPPQATRLADEDLTFPSSIPSKFIESISKAMSSGRKKRHESISEFIKEINEAVQHESEDTRTEETIINERTFIDSSKYDSKDISFQKGEESPKILIKLKKWILPIVFAVIIAISAVFLSPFISRCTQQNHIKNDTRSLVRPDGRVSDINGYLSAEQMVLLNNVNDSVSNATGLQIVSMIVKNTQTNEFKLYNDSVFNSWGIGDSIKNNGILIGIDVIGRKIAVTTGLGIPEINKEGISFWQTVVDSMQYYCKKRDYFNALKIGSLMTGKCKELADKKNDIHPDNEQSDNKQLIKVNENKKEDNIKDNNESKGKRNVNDDRQEILNKAIKDGILGTGQIMLLAEHEHYVPAYFYYAKNLLQQGKTKEAREYLRKSISANVNVSECKDLLDILNE